MGYQPNDATSLNQYDKFHIQDLLSLGFSPYEIYGIAEKIGWDPDYIELELEKLGHYLIRKPNITGFSEHVKIPRQYKAIIKQINKSLE